MKSHKSIIAGLGLATLCSFGCGPKPYEPKPIKPLPEMSLKSEADMLALFPVAEGNQWNYTGEMQSIVNNKPATGKFEFSLKISKVEEIANGKRATLDLIQNDKVVEQQVWEIRKDGIYQKSAGKTLVEFEPPQPAVVFPIKNAEKFTWKGVGPTPMGSKGPSQVTSVADDSGFADTEMGRFRAVAVASEIIFATGNYTGASTNTTWWAPKIGLVRLVQQTQVRQAKSTTLAATGQKFTLKSYVVK